MKKYIITIIIILSFVNIYAAFEDYGWTARSRALANSIFGDFDGVNSMNYNPATISMTRSIQTYLSWDAPFAGLNDNTMINVVNFIGVFPFFSKFTIPAENPIANFISRRGAIGISIRRTSLTGYHLDGSPSEFYHEGIYSFVYAKDLNDVLLRGAKISAGIMLSIYDIGVGEFYDVVANSSIYSEGTMLLKIGFGLDVGLTYDFSEAIRIGLIFKNLIPPNISILPDGNDILPTEMKLGFNWNLGDIFFLNKSKLGFGVISYGRDSFDPRQTEMAYIIGFEFKQLPAELLVKGKSYKDELFSIRLGARYQDNKINEDIISITGGIGFVYVFENSHQLNLDYSIEYIANMGSFKHSVGATYNYIIPKSLFLYKRQLDEEEEIEEILDIKNIIEWKTNVVITNINKLDIYITNIYSNNILINTNEIKLFISNIMLSNQIEISNLNLSNQFISTNTNIVSPQSIEKTKSPSKRGK